MELPCLTIRPVAAYKSHGFYFTEELYNKYTFTLEDIFYTKTIEMLRNTRNQCYKVPLSDDFETRNRNKLN
jgi:hypothetical protein